MLVGLDKILEIFLEFVAELSQFFEDKFDQMTSTRPCRCLHDRGERWHLGRVHYRPHRHLGSEVIPGNYGGWYFKGGFQWYDLINNNLVISENESVGCAINAAESCKTSGASGSASSVSARTSDPIRNSLRPTRGPKRPARLFYGGRFCTIQLRRGS
jgi:hypothetical protein